MCLRFGWYSCGTVCGVTADVSAVSVWLPHEIYPLTPSTRAHLLKKTSTPLHTLHGFIPSPQLQRRFLSYFLSSQGDGADMNGISSWPLVEELKCEPRGGSQSWCSWPLTLTHPLAIGSLEIRKQHQQWPTLILCALAGPPEAPLEELPSRWAYVVEPSSIKVSWSSSS